MWGDLAIKHINILAAETHDTFYGHKYTKEAPVTLGQVGHQVSFGDELTQKFRAFFFWFWNYGCVCELEFLFSTFALSVYIYIYFLVSLVFKFFSRLSGFVSGLGCL